MAAILPLSNLSVRLPAAQNYGAQTNAQQSGADNQAAQDRTSRPAQAYQAANQRLAATPRDSIVVSAATLAAYAKDPGLSLPLAHLSTPEQAMRYLEDVLGRMVVSADKIKTLVQARQAVLQPESFVAQGAARLAQMHAEQVGQQLAAEKDLQRLSAALAKAFDLGQPIYRQENGTVSFNPTDFSFAGRLLAQLMPDGRAAMVREEEKLARQPASFGKFGAAQPNVGQSNSWQPSAGFGPGLVVVAVVIATFMLMF